MGSLSEYQRSAGAVHGIGWHVVSWPKYRKNVLVGPPAERLRRLLGEQRAERRWSVEALEVMPDHVHVFVHTPPDTSPARVAHQLKGFTSQVLRSEFGPLRCRLPIWSKAYFGASVGRVSEARIGRYVDERTTSPVKGRP